MKCMREREWGVHKMNMGTSMRKSSGERLSAACGAVPEHPGGDVTLNPTLSSTCGRHNVV